MKNRIAIFTIALVWLVASAAVSNGQVRDAASKALGEYGREPSSYSGRVPYTRSAPQFSQGGSAAAPSASSGTRAFSYDTPGSQPRAAANAPGGPSNAATRPQSTRSFSYQPPSVAPRQVYSAPRGWQSGVRDAGSKVRGEY